MNFGCLPQANFESNESDLLWFDRVFDLHFRIQTNFGQVLSTQL